MVGEPHLFFPGLFLISALWAAIGCGLVTRHWQRSAMSAVLSFVLTASATLLLVTSHAPNPLDASFFLSVGGLLTGAALGTFMRERRIGRSLTHLFRKFSALYGGRAARLVAVAFVVSIALTGYFATKVPWTVKDGFWWGFYQSWTAGFVAFMVFGVASIMASLPRPSDEPFKRRIANLYNTSDIAAIDYLSERAQMVGYYAVSVERTYKVHDYDRKRNAYRIMVIQRTVARNFLHDTSIPDKLLFKIGVGEEDRLVPPLPVLGTLQKVDMDGKPMRTKSGRPLPLDITESAGISEEWDIEILPGADASIEMVHVCHYKADTVHEWFPTRFTKSAKFFIEYCASGHMPEVKVQMDGNSQSIALAFGSTIQIGEVVYRVPGEAAITFSIGAPPMSPGGLACLMADEEA